MVLLSYPASMLGLEPLAPLPHRPVLGHRLISGREHGFTGGWSLALGNLGRSWLKAVGHHPPHSWGQSAPVLKESTHSLHCPAKHELIMTLVQSST